MSGPSLSAARGAAISSNLLLFPNIYIFLRINDRTFLFRFPSAKFTTSSKAVKTFYDRKNVCGLDCLYPNADSG